MARKSTDKSAQASAKAPKKAAPVRSTTPEGDAFDVANVLFRTRQATISVAVAGMIFCAVFWPSVLDFKAKLAHNPALDELREDVEESSEPVEVAVDDSDDWGDQLDAIYPREDFHASDDDTDAADAPSGLSAFAENDFGKGFSAADLESDANPFDSFAREDAPLPPSFEETTEDAEALTDASLFANDALLDEDATLFNNAPADAPLPEAPRAVRSSYAPTPEDFADADPLAEPLEAPDSYDNPLLADLAPVDPSDPLGLDSQPLPEAPTLASHAPAIAPSATLSAGASAFEPEPALAPVPDAPIADAPAAPATNDLRTGVASASYDAFAAPNPVAPAADLIAAAPVDELSSVDAPTSAPFDAAPATNDLPVATDSLAAPVASVASDLPVATDSLAAPVASVTNGLPVATDSLAAPVASVASDLPVATDSLAAPAAPVANDLPDETAALAANEPSPTSDAVAEPENAEATESEDGPSDELLAAAEAALAPSYFSRAVGLYGGQRAFSSLYFARAARLVSDSGAWSPDSFSRVTPILTSNASAPTKSQNAASETTAAPEPEEETPATSDEDVAAEEMRAKYPTLVGYVERKTIKSPEPLPVVGAAQNADNQ